MAPSQAGGLNSRNPLLELLARIGYGARGLVYILVGGLALYPAFGFGGQAEGAGGALRVVLGQTFGWVWLGLIGAGLVFFALWRFAQAILDADRLGVSLKMLVRRVGYLGGAVVAASLAVSSFSLAIGLVRHTGSAEETLRTWLGWLMHQAFGPWLIMGIGAAIVVVGVVAFSQAFRTERVVEFLHCPPGVGWWAVPLGRLGFAGRGVVLAVIGGFIVLAGYNGRSGEARSVEGALDFLDARPYGWLTLGGTALGLMAYGAFGFVQARYRQVEPPRLDQ